jgi:hypothetical protein
MKVQAKYYKEIEYVVVRELPQSQQDKLKDFTQADFIKILIDGHVTGPCLQYKQYAEWYVTVFAPQVEGKLEQKPLPLKNLAWDKV